jgi:hypothetical protein
MAISIRKDTCSNPQIPLRFINSLSVGGVYIYSLLSRSLTLVYKYVLIVLEFHFLLFSRRLTDNVDATLYFMGFYLKQFNVECGTFLLLMEFPLKHLTYSHERF